MLGVCALVLRVSCQLQRMDAIGACLMHGLAALHLPLAPFQICLWCWVFVYQCHVFRVSGNSLGPAARKALLHRAAAGSMRGRSLAWPASIGRLFCLYPWLACRMVHS